MRTALTGPSAFLKDTNIFKAIKRGLQRLVARLCGIKVQQSLSPMTEQEMLTLGTYCNGVMRSDDFVTVCSRYEQQVVQMILQTQPGEAAVRENLYHKVTGFRDFLSSMADLAEAAEAIKTKNEPKQSDED